MKPATPYERYDFRPSVNEIVQMIKAQCDAIKFTVTATDFDPNLKKKTDTLDTQYKRLGVQISLFEIMRQAMQEGKV